MPTATFDDSFNPALWPKLGGVDAPERVWNMEPDRTMSIPGNVRIGGSLVVVGGIQDEGTAGAQAAHADLQDVAALLAELDQLKERVNALEAALTETRAAPEDNGNGGRRRRGR